MSARISKLLCPGVVLTELRGRATIRRVGVASDFPVVAEMMCLLGALTIWGLIVLLWVLPGSTVSEEPALVKAGLSLFAASGGWVLARTALHGVRMGTVFDYNIGELHQIHINGFGRTTVTGRMPLDWLESLYVDRGEGTGRAHLRARLRNGTSILIGSGQTSAMQAIHTRLTQGAETAAEMAVDVSVSGPAVASSVSDKRKLATRAVAAKRRVRVHAA